MLVITKVCAGTGSIVWSEVADEPCVVFGDGMFYWPIYN